MNRRMEKPKLMAEINITPFTDVVLVLLIIFMIATPFIYQSSMNVQLPQASKSEETTRDMIVTISSKGEIFLDNMKTDLNSLKTKLSAAVRSKPNSTVIVNGDRSVRYDSVIQVMDVLTRSGVKNPGLGVELKK